jgi:hypothetical protein
MIAFINDHREAYGIEPICKVLPIAPSTYHDHVAKRLDPSRLSDRAKRDEALKIEVRRVFEENPARLIWPSPLREAASGVAPVVASTTSSIWSTGSRSRPAMDARAGSPNI